MTEIGFLPAARGPVWAERIRVSSSHENLGKDVGLMPFPPQSRRPTRYRRKTPAKSKGE